MITRTPCCSCAHGRTWLTLRAGALHPGLGSLDNHGPLELGKDATHLHHGLAQGGSCVDTLLLDTRKCHDAIAARHAHAVIPPRKNAKPWKPTSPGAIARNEAVNASGCPRRAIWRRWSGYHRRSCVENKMTCIKLLGQSLMSRDFDRQVAEIQVRIAVLNR